MGVIRVRTWRRQTLKPGVERTGRGKWQGPIRWGCGGGRTCCDVRRRWERLRRGGPYSSIFPNMPSSSSSLRPPWPPRESRSPSIMSTSSWTPPRTNES